MGYGELILWLLGLVVFVLLMIYFPVVVFMIIFVGAFLAFVWIAKEAIDFVCK